MGRQRGEPAPRPVRQPQPPPTVHDLVAAGAFTSSGVGRSTPRGLDYGAHRQDSAGQMGRHVPGDGLRFSPPWKALANQASYTLAWNHPTWLASACLVAV